MLKLESLKKKYLVSQEPFYTLKGIDLSFDKVQFVSILGPSGCGKTTLLNIIGGLDKASEGDVISEGRALSSLSEKELDSYRNNSIGFIFQNCYLIPQLNVLENVKIALSVRDYTEKECDEKALDALKKVHAEFLAKKKVNQLSGGQQQRVAIARALVTDPLYLLCDEPTGALDSTSAREIMELIQEVSKTKLVLFVTHNEELALKYSDRIIRMKDGQVTEDILCRETDELSSQEQKLRKSKLSFGMKMKLAFRNMWSRKGKTVLTGIANSFGMIGIAFLLAINHGFDLYSTKISKATATSLPVVVTPYTSTSSSEAFQSINNSIEYPEKQEIYPSVESSSETAYKFNNITPQYMSYLDSLVKEGVIREYITSYGNSYGFNLSTRVPASLDGEEPSKLSMLSTTKTNYNYYAYSAGLPYNIFHVLYGDFDSYDVIAGSLPQNENELVLVVDKYNAVSFKILQALGFYSASDSQEDVKDISLKTKVRPISFEDVIDKEYKLFYNDDIYINPSEEKVNDGLGRKRTITTYEKRELDEDFYKNKGISLKISGIVRAKSTSTFSILSPSLCYTSTLQDKLMKKNRSSQVTNTIQGNIVFSPSEGDSVNTFIDEITTLLEAYQNSESSVLPTSSINDILQRYFVYYPYLSSRYLYRGFSKFFSQAMALGSELVKDSMKNIDFSDEETIDNLIRRMKTEFLTDYDKLYEEIISLAAYVNAYSTIQCLVIFPPDLQNRDTLLKRLDEYNEKKKETGETIEYAQSDANYMIQDVGDMISLVSMILVIFAVISLTVSALMTALLISVNVLERKKEIGLLRSFGSRKFDILSLFEIESVFIGLLAGIIGSLSTYILAFPINYMINKSFSYYSVGRICNFTFYHALIIIFISVVISMISSFLPSHKASRVTPIESLRSE